MRITWPKIKSTEYIEIYGMPIQYENGKIYRILCPDGQYYIGSTTSTLEQRLRQHKMQGKQNPNRKVYKTIHEQGWDSIEIELLEDFPCTTKNELTAREDIFIKQAKENDPMCLNVIRSHVTQEEKKELLKQYYEAHKEEIKEQHKEYYADPVVKEKTDQYQADYRKRNAEKRRAYSKQYAQDHLEEVKQARKEYYQTKKEELIAKNKAYVEANKEIVQERKRRWTQAYKEKNAEAIQAEQAQRKQARQAKTQDAKQQRETPVLCECGGTYQPYRKSRHDASKKHQLYAKPPTS